MKQKQEVFTYGSPKLLGDITYVNILQNWECLCFKKEVIVDAKHLPTPFLGKGKNVNKTLFFFFPKELLYTFQNQSKDSLRFEEHRTVLGTSQTNELLKSSPIAF